MDDYDPNSLSVTEARARIERAIQPLTATEVVPLQSVLGRVLAQDIRSPMNVPAHANSAMDGYAVRGADLPEQGTRELQLIGTAWAGMPCSATVHAGQCVRIMTGAMLPEGSDTVIMQERAERVGDAVRIGADNKAGQHVRQAGEDIALGEIVLPKGKLLRPSESGVLASLGIAEIIVTRRLRVAFFTTGDELRTVGEPLASGQIYDSNRYTLHGMLNRLGVELIDLGIVRDRREDIENIFTQAATRSDVIVSSGGVSVGEADFVRETLERLGKIHFWKIAMKPGRPLAFGRVGDACFFGLPGNPVSVMATFYQFVQPALRHMMGQSVTYPFAFKVPCATRLKKAPGRMEFQRGILEKNHEGALVVRSTGEQGSGILSSMSLANCFIVLPDEMGTAEPGTLVEVQVFEGLV
jgi:molybdopterin molybdotransferase